MVSPQTPPSLDVATPPDCLVEQSVEDWHDEEGEEGHHNEVGQEDVVPDVVGVVPQVGGADGERHLLAGGVGPGGDHAGTDGHHLVWGLDAGVELKPSVEQNIVKYQQVYCLIILSALPWNVPDQAQ